MKAIMVMFDSLNRHMLPPYGCDWVHAPNFSRLAARTVVFERSYVGSLPCMPARREMHTGRYNFLHRSWGPVEPFDDSMPEILNRNGVYTHLVSDHYHYWEDGGATYHNRYTSWEVSRGQEGDHWKGQVADPDIPPVVIERSGSPSWRQDWVNRGYMTQEESQPQPKTFALGLEFIRTNYQGDNWFLQIETFDPHEPFFTQQSYKDLYPHDNLGAVFDWPPYERVSQTPEQVQHVRYEYAALVSMCDAYLGKVLDVMDELDLWKDTLLIVNTDHGFLLGEHGWWAKIVQPVYNQIANTPLFIWDPRCGKRGERRSSLVQTIDLAPTLLDFFGVEIPQDMQGHALKEVIASDQPVREGGLYGIHGAHVCVTDGRYVYMRAPSQASNQPLYEYTLMPTHMNHIFTPVEFQDISLAEPFSFTKGCKTLRLGVDTKEKVKWHEFGNLLFDLQQDPEQEHPIRDPQVEERMIRLMVGLMKANEAPPEQYTRLGLQSYI